MLGYWCSVCFSELHVPLVPNESVVLWKVFLISDPCVVFVDSVFLLLLLFLLVLLLFGVHVMT